MAADPLLVRTAGLYAPIAATLVLAYLRRPGRPALTGALLATLWNLPALWLVHLLAVDQGWWTFQPVPGAVDGLPADLWIGWALLWGAVPVLAPRVPTWVLIAAAAWIDVVLMPACAPLLRLGERWWIGELLAVVVALVPGVLLGRWTSERRRLAGRTILQAVCFTAITLGLGVRFALGAEHLGWPDRPAWAIGVALQALLLPGAVALAGVAEFASRGGGTPFPYDPPRRLVTTGPYAFVANPMQLGMVLTVLTCAAFLGSLAVAVGAVLGATFAAGLASWHERAQLTARYGESWLAYRREVRDWLPNRRPYVSGEAVLYAGLSCDVCSPVADWLAGRDPRGLRIVDAADWPGEPLRRMTYVGADGYRVDGVRAVARALEHTTLSWAFAGWLLRLPVLSTVVQLLLDASGGGPRAVVGADR